MAVATKLVNIFSEPTGWLIAFPMASIPRTEHPFIMMNGNMELLEKVALIFNGAAVNLGYNDKNSVLQIRLDKEKARKIADDEDIETGLELYCEKKRNELEAVEAFVRAWLKKNENQIKQWRRPML